MEAFKERLRQLGWIEGQNLRIDIRWNAGDALARTYAAQLIGLMPDVIVAGSKTAKALGIEIPLKLQAFADEVIE
jgi:putative tryptophan/tyrosine transport system substrate-binding protein